MAALSLTHRNEKTTAFLLNALQHKASSSAKTTSAYKYDAAYTKEKEASFAGIFLFVVPVLFSFFSSIDIAKNGGADTYVKVMVVGALVLRVVATRWIASIAAEQNRSTAKWMTLSFFLPAITLMIIGQTKKLAAPVAREQKNNTYNAKDGFKRLAAGQDLSLQMAS